MQWVYNDNRSLKEHHSVIQNLHQILFTDPGSPSPDGYIKQAMLTVRSAFPGCNYRLWNLADAERLIEHHFDPDVLDAFHLLRPYSFKADLFKFCLLYVHGGWYVDAGVTVMTSPLAVFTPDSTPEWVLFRGTGAWDAPWSCSAAFIYATPGQATFTTAIDEVLGNCRQRYYGVNPLSPTMSPFGRALATHKVNENVKMGTVVDVWGEDYFRGYQLKPLGIIAARKPKTVKPGNIAEIGAKGSNDYVQMWRDREVYAS